MQSGDGGAAFVPTHGSRYEQPAASVIIGVWSSPLFHPLPTFTEGALVNVGPGSVTSEPVGVYVGSSSGAPP